MQVAWTVTLEFTRPDGWPISRTLLVLGDRPVFEAVSIAKDRVESGWPHKFLTCIRVDARRAEEAVGDEIKEWVK